MSRPLFGISLPLPLLLVSFFVLIPIRVVPLVFGQQFSATCYAPDGTAASDGSYMPCNFSGGASMCCPTNSSSSSNTNGGDPRSGGGGGSRDTCTEGGLCIGQSDGKTRRGYCTDQSWKSSACVSICTDPSDLILTLLQKAGGSSSGAAILNYCPDEQNTYCCGDGNTTCCGTSFAHTLAGSATVTLSTVVSTAFVTYTPSASAESSHPPLSGAAREALSTGGKAGVGIGAGVGGLAIIAVALALVYRARRRRQKQKQNSKMDEAEGEGSRGSSSATDEAAAATAAGENRRSSSTDGDPTSPTKTSELGGRALERTPGELDGEGARFEVPATAITTGGRGNRAPSSSWRGDPVPTAELGDESEVKSPRESQVGSLRKINTN
ncbi:hypothetical protein PG993_005310 [Apiospora rasikravindrae]|uniref:Uncharacterized protein n=1 Tax=Apiospora rasikravindrae TaxID=990691 RepID=A0ABR1TF75_9PEZI